MRPQGPGAPRGGSPADPQLASAHGATKRFGELLAVDQVDLQVAEIEVHEGKAAIASLEKGEGALSVEETRTRLELAEKKVERLRQEAPVFAQRFEVWDPCLILKGVEDECVSAFHLP